ncbi:cyclin-J18 [Artemisia annua]|uniref:Cyclin-J18 n=1 Tax=Artemisia annua TaxID=35608 RepID=A0A2U1MGH3_ARTAN|nr:cyclin-J18 [Artemisia annua]
MEVCMDIMDLLYEKEETSTLYSSPHSLAASILVASYVISVPKQRWEFPLLPWAGIRFLDASCGYVTLNRRLSFTLEHRF